MMANMADKKAQKTASKAVKFDNGIYTELTFAARLQDIRLVSSEYAIKPDVFEALKDTDSLGYFGKPSEFHFDVTTGMMIGHYRWTAEIKSGRTKVLKLVSEYLIVYTGLSGFEEDYVRFFFNKVGRFATYPYFRTNFSHHSCASGIMLPPLPSLNERVN